MMQSAHFCLPVSEAERLWHFPEGNAVQRFFQVLTSKEAVLKAPGDGLFDSLRDVPGFTVEGMRN